MEEEGWHARGVGGEGILWGMPGESRGNGRAAQCACVELISSPSTLHPPRPPRPRHPLATAPRSRSTGSARGEHGVPWDLAPLPLRTFHPLRHPLSTIPSLFARSLFFPPLPSSSRYVFSPPVIPAFPFLLLLFGFLTFFSIPPPPPFFSFGSIFRRLPLSSNIDILSSSSWYFCGMDIVVVERHLRYLKMFKLKVSY